jgi:hypothetical protein
VKRILKSPWATTAMLSLVFGPSLAHALRPLPDPQELCPLFASVGPKGKDIRSSNLPAPAVDLGREAQKLAADPLRPEEVRLLEMSGLSLYPDPARMSGGSPEAEFHQWAQDLDLFLRASRPYSDVRELLGKYLLDFVNHPHGEAIVGDASWKEPRHISNWRDLYRLPINYDLNGKQMVMPDGNPVVPGPATISAIEVNRQPKLTSQIYGNLQNVLQFRGLIEDGTLTGDKAYAKLVMLRRTYLTLRLIQEGEVVQVMSPGVPRPGQ